MFLSLALPLLLLHHCHAYLDTLYTTSDEDYLYNLLTSAQDPSTGLFSKSLTTSADATEAISAVYQQPIPAASALCASLENQRVSSWEDFHNLLLTRARLPKCLTSLQDSWRKKLSNGLSASKLSHVFYAINAAHTLSAQNLFDTADLAIADILQHLLTFRVADGMFSENSGNAKKRKSSVHKTALALQATARLLTLSNATPAQKTVIASAEVQKSLGDFVAAAKSLLSETTNIGSEMVSYSESLTATATVIEAVHAFVTALDSLGANSADAALTAKLSNAKFIEKLTRYVLSFRATTSPTSARHVTVLMQLLRTSTVMSAPISVSVSNRIFHDEAAQNTKESPLTVRITDVFDRAVMKSDAVPKANIAVSVAGEKNTYDMVADIAQNAFTFALGAQIRALASSGERHGVYNDIAIAVDGFETISTSIKVTTSVTSASLGAQTAKSRDDGFVKATFPDALGGVLDVSPSRKLKLELKIEAAQRPSHISVVFVDSAGQRALQTTPKKRAEKYVLNVDTAKAEFSALREGEYSVRVVISDALFAAPLEWASAARVRVTEEEEETEEAEYEPVDDEVPKWTAQTEIAHTFADSAENLVSGAKMRILSLVFCGAVMAPLLWLCGYVAVGMRVGVRVESEVQVSSCLFMLSLGGVAAVLGVYFWKWNIFEAGAWLIAVMVCVGFFGYHVLRRHLMHGGGGGGGSKKVM